MDDNLMAYYLYSKDKETQGVLYTRNKVWYRASFEMKFGILRDKFKLKKFQSLYFVFEYWFRNIR